jgi:hypothetical protein
MSSGQAIRMVAGIWDSETYVDNTTTGLQLGSLVKGAGTSIWGASGAKTTSDTWFSQTKQLGAGYHLSVRAVAVYWDPNAAPADIALVTRDGWMTLNIGSATQFEMPLERLTQGSGIVGFAGAAATALFGSNGVPDPRAVWKLSPESIEIGGLDQINWRVDWSTAINTAANVKFRAHLLGVLDRPV